MITWLEKHNKLCWGITFLIAIWIFYISSLTFAPAQGGARPNINATLYHLIAYFLLGVFLFLSCVRGKFRYLIIPSGLAVIIYGIADEIHQLFVPRRYFSWGDIFLDAVGVSFAFLIYLISLEYRRVNGYSM